VTAANWGNATEASRVLAVNKCISLAIPFEGIVFRGCTPRYATGADLLTGEGSRRKGGRWNPQNSFPAVYTSVDVQTAWDECLAAGRYYGWAVQDSLPLTMVAIAVKFHQILDLRYEGLAYETLEITRDLIVRENWHDARDPAPESAVQACGRIIRMVGFEGMLVPSAAKSGGSNLIWFPGRLLAESERELKIINAEKLGGGT
jgi:RES domain-containing protein